MHDAAIAYTTNLPFVYTNFSGMVNSALGKTQKNIGMVFDYARKSPCVLCLDEIDAIGTRRGGKDDVAEVNNPAQTGSPIMDGACGATRKSG